MEAFVLIEVGVGKTKDVVQSLEKVAGVKAVHAVTGPYDIIAMVEQPDVDSIGSLVTQKVHTIPGVSRTITCLTLKLT